MTIAYSCKSSAIILAIFRSNACRFDSGNVIFLLNTFTMLDYSYPPLHQQQLETLHKNFLCHFKCSTRMVVVAVGIFSMFSKNWRHTASD